MIETPNSNPKQGGNESGCNPDGHLTHKLPVSRQTLSHLATELLPNCPPGLKLETSEALFPCGFSVPTS